MSSEVEGDRFVPEQDVSEGEALSLVRESYEAIAEQYLSQVLALEDDDRITWTRRLLDQLPGAGRVLEVGCGAGLPVAKQVVDAGYALTGVDISPRQVEMASANVPAADFAVGNIAEATFDPGTFDAVVMLYVIGHIPRARLPRLFRDMARWLTPEGRFLVTLTMNESPSYVEDDFLGTGVTSWTNGHPAETTLALLRHAGFEVVEQETLAESGGAGQWVWVIAKLR